MSDVFQTKKEFKIFAKYLDGDHLTPLSIILPKNSGYFNIVDEKKIHNFLHYWKCIQNNENKNIWWKHYYWFLLIKDCLMMESKCKCCSIITIDVFL